MRDNALLMLVALLAPLSLVSVGGGPSIFAEIQHQAVDVHRWMDSAEFVEMFAIARAAPGPGSMLATLVGLKVAGLPGALVATLAMFVPSSILVYLTLRVWNRFRGRLWHTALEEGLAPIGGGLILAGALAISRISGAGAVGWCIAGGATAALMMWPRVSPLLIFAAGGGIYALSAAFLV
jgi:chromate transporter